MLRKKLEQRDLETQDEGQDGRNDNAKCPAGVQRTETCPPQSFNA